MNGAQLTMLVFYVIVLSIELVMNGKPRTGKHSFLASTAVVAAIFSVLYWGGFWEGAIK